MEPLKKLINKAIKIIRYKIKFYVSFAKIGNSSCCQKKSVARFGFGCQVY